MGEAVREARASGMLVVLCTGRRYRTTQPILEQLDLTGPVVVQNGVVVKDGATGETLQASYVPTEVYPRAIEMLSALGPPAVYVDLEPDPGTDLVAESAGDHHPFLAEYLEANRAQTRFVESLATPPSRAITMLSAMAELETLRAVERELSRAPIESLRTNLVANKSYRGHILEIVNADTGKWRRLRELARSLGISNEEIVAIGDDTNDLEMIENAGLGIAMANAIEAVRRVADHVVPSNDEDGAAHAIRNLLP